MQMRPATRQDGCNVFLVWGARCALSVRKQRAFKIQMYQAQNFKICVCWMSKQIFFAVEHQQKQQKKLRLLRKKQY